MIIVEHAYLWYHVPYYSIESVWEMANNVSIYKHCMHMCTQKMVQDIGCSEI